MCHCYFFRIVEYILAYFCEITEKKKMFDNNKDFTYKLRSSAFFRRTRYLTDYACENIEDKNFFSVSSYRYCTYLTSLHDETSISNPLSYQLS